MSYKSLETVIREAACGCTKMKEQNEVDDEGNMAKGELRMIASRAQELISMLDDNTQLEGWVQSKITKAEDYINSVYDYMKGQKGN
jgi:hypothetical protein